jgi:hypothetical protein
VQEIRIRGPKKTGEAPPQPFAKEYPEPEVTRFPQSKLRSYPTMVALLLALLVTQAASVVCTAQCLQHQQHTQTSAATGHCHAMQPSSNNPAAQTCPATATSFCVTDLLANDQQKTSLQPTVQAIAPILLPFLTTTPRTLTLLQPRSTVGDPPLITPLRL